MSIADEQKIEKLLAIVELNKTGYAGILSTGEIVDRRLFPDAIPIPENPLFNVAKPKKLSSDVTIYSNSKDI